MRDKTKDRSWKKARRLFSQRKKQLNIKKEKKKSKQSYLNDFNKKYKH